LVYPVWEKQKIFYWIRQTLPRRFHYSSDFLYSENFSGLSLTNILIGWVAPVTAIGMALAILDGSGCPSVFGWVSWVLLEYLILMVEWTHCRFSSVNY
jgi:hypothetical protein